LVSSHKKEGDDKTTSGRGYSKHLIGAGVGILVMAVALVAIVATYLWFGHIGSSFSTSVMEKQQARLRQQYGLPPQPPLPPKLLEVPPSLRNVHSNGEGTETAAAASGNGSSSNNSNSNSSSPAVNSNISIANSNNNLSSLTSNNKATSRGP
jgi:hypothetical protein